ncbi:hypothetical protein GQ457_07G037180 [Hibiscus cannabinus]
MVRDGEDDEKEDWSGPHLNLAHPNNLAELRNSEANSAPRNLIYGATLSTRSREFQREILMVIETGL